MTAEQITLIEPSDLRAIRLVCSKCRASVTVRLNETVSIPTKCPVCEMNWNETRSLATPHAALALANALKAFCETDRQDRRFMLHFEMPTPKQ
jgi:hypothetical protein